MRGDDRQLLMVVDDNTYGPRAELRRMFKAGPPERDAVAPLQ